MNRTRNNPFAVAMLVVASLALAWIAAPPPARGADARRVLVYAPHTQYSVDITTLDGTDYVGLFELLEPLRHAETRVDGKNWKLILAGIPPMEARFRDRKREFSLDHGTMQLSANFRLVSGRGYVPLASVDWLMTRLTGMNSEMHGSTHHLYLGGVASRINVELRKQPSKLVLSFPFAVDPSITNEGGTLHLGFSREPVVSNGNDVFNFSDGVFSVATFSETSNGAEFVVRGTAPLTVALADSGHTIVISGPPPLPPQPVAVVSPPPTVSQPPTSTLQPAPAVQPPASSTPVRKAFAVIVDAGHGGADAGGALTDRLLEKDLNLALARRVAHELQVRGIPAVLLRSGDAQLEPEQRAAIANSAAATRVYLSLHSVASGQGVRIYRSMLARSQPAGRATFVPWQRAQAQWIDRSSELASAIAAECSQRQISAHASAASVLPLDNIAGPAVAVEVSPLGEKPGDIATTEYQQAIAVAIANAIVSLQPKTGGAQ